MGRVGNQLRQRAGGTLVGRSIINIRFTDPIPGVNTYTGVGFLIQGIAIRGDDAEIKIIPQMIDYVGNGAYRAAGFVAGKVMANKG